MKTNIFMEIVDNDNQIFASFGSASIRSTANTPIGFTDGYFWENVGAIDKGTSSS